MSEPPPPGHAFPVPGHQLPPAGSDSTDPHRAPGIAHTTEGAAHRALRTVFMDEHGVLTFGEDHG
jgi:hypothetical protein